MNPEGLIGVLIILGLSYLLSNNRSLIKPRIVCWGLGLQFFFALILLKIPYLQAPITGITSEILILEKDIQFFPMLDFNILFINSSSLGPPAIKNLH